MRRKYHGKGMQQKHLEHGHENAQTRGHNNDRAMQNCSKKLSTLRKSASGILLGVPEEQNSKIHYVLFTMSALKMHLPADIEDALASRHTLINHLMCFKQSHVHGKHVDKAFIRKNRRIVRIRNLIHLHNPREKFVGLHEDRKRRGPTLASTPCTTA